MRKLTPLALLATFAATPALAHISPVHGGSLLAGATHPLFGLDHILAMVAVGLWAAQLGGRALWMVPLGFVGTMVAGYALGLAGTPLPFVEPMILASTVILGLAVALAVKPSSPAATVLVGLFALFHGHAHGAEIGAAQPALFLAGFALATAALHGAGIVLGIGLQRRALALRVLGGGTAIAGLALAFA